MNNEEAAKMFCDAIRTFNYSPDALDNFESYLAEHFDEWLGCYADTPEEIAREIKTFSEIEF